MRLCEMGLWISMEIARLREMDHESAWRLRDSARWFVNRHEDCVTPWARYMNPQVNSVTQCVWFTTRYVHLWQCIYVELHRIDVEYAISYVSQIASMLKNTISYLAQSRILTKTCHIFSCQTSSMLNRLMLLKKHPCRSHYMSQGASTLHIM